MQNVNNLLLSHKCNVIIEVYVTYILRQNIDVIIIIV